MTIRWRRAVRRPADAAAASEGGRRRGRGRRHAWLAAVGLVPTLLATALCLARPALLGHLELSIYDALVRRVEPRPPSGRVAIVDVDERSLAAIGQWPWRRDVVADLVARLRGLGAAAIALDIIFAEPDRSQSETLDPDAALAASLRDGRVVLGYGLTFEGQPSAADGCVQHPLGLSVVVPPGVDAGEPFFVAASAVCNLQRLTQAAPASGFLNAAPDGDGVLRRVPLVAGVAGRTYPSLALAAVSAATGTRAEALHVVNATAATLRMGDRFVPMDGRGNLLVRFRGVKGTFPFVSAADVMRGAAPAGAVRGKVVFVGTTALGTREVVATPLDTLFTGVEVQATAADNLLQHDAIVRPGHAAAIETLAVLLLGFVVLLTVWRFGLPAGGAVLAAIVVLVWSLAWRLLSGPGVFLSPLYPTIGLSAAFVAMVVAGFTAERARAERAGAANETSRRLMVQTLLSLTGIRDVETGRHCRRTQRYTRLLAEELARHPDYQGYLTPERIDLLASLAPLHDIGKVGVPDSVLNKPGKLTSDELAEMRRHPIYGRDVIENAERAAGVRDDLTLAVAKDIVYSHHEKWDGTGYPEGLRGTAIPIPGRVMALVDVYDAVHTRRLYQTPRSHDDTLAFIRSGRGTHFDPAVVDAFVAVADRMHALADDEDAASAGPPAARP